MRNTCADCNRIYHNRSRTGAPRFNMRVYADPAVCGVCDLTAGNSADIPVYRYPLKRHLVGVGQKWIGSIGICDGCLPRIASLRAPFSTRTRSRTTDDGLRSHDGLPTSVAL